MRFSEIKSVTASAMFFCCNASAFAKKIFIPEMSIEPDEHMLIIPHVNQPGMIAKVATVIGKDNVNISRMHVAKNTNEDPISIMLINTDSKVEGDTLKEITQIDGIKDAKYIHLDA